MKPETNSASAPTPAADDPITIAVRAYVEQVKKPDKSKAKPGYQPPPLGPSDIVLIFDTETKLDAAQHLRFGTYQVRIDGKLDEEGLFFDSRTIIRRDRRALQAYAKKHGLRCRTSEDFIDSVFYGVAYDLGATIVGFNLPFDIARIAIGFSTAKSRYMRGGFTFKLSTDPRRGHVQVKILSGLAPFIRFANPEYRKKRRRDNEVPASEGHFVDIRALAAALTNKPFKLKTLAEFLRTRHQKLDSDVLSGPLDERVIEYARTDTQVTWECFQQLRERYLKHGLSGTDIQDIHSVASMGKAYLAEMGVKPLKSVQPDVPPTLIGHIMSAYYGGRSEVRLRRMITQVAYCDFLSMYPTVCSLMGLWRFMIASGFDRSDATMEVRTLLPNVSLEALRDRDLWRGLTTLVRVRPSADILPVRAKYGIGPDSHYTIGLNYLTCPEPLWFTLADCIASTLLCGKPPEVLEALRFVPRSPQPGLRPVLVCGNPDYRIDPTHDDFFRRAIELRIETKTKMRAATGAKKRTYDAEQEFLKVLANSTAYGISVQINPADFDKRYLVDVFGPRDNKLQRLTDRYETPGPYFHPLLGAVTTGAARLMLAITERLIFDASLDWALCDTDSMAIAKPTGMDDGDFCSHIGSIRDWFVPLNPYGTNESLLKLEDANFAIQGDKITNRFEPLYCYAISSKRYALFNLDSKDRPILRKASAHGLGHLRAPYED